MAVEDLRAALLAVPGVASVEVTEVADSEPVVRLWLDGTREAPDVQRDVDHVISLRGYRRKAVPEPAGAVAEPPGNGRRGGLGRGLETLIPVALEEEPPSHLHAVPRIRFTKLSIEESSGGVSVRAIDASGRERAATVHGDGERALLEAVAAAVAGLHGVAAPRLLAVEEQALAGSDVVTVVVELTDGSRRAGAAVISGGKPFTVGKAVDAALSVD